MQTFKYILILALGHMLLPTMHAVVEAEGEKAEPSLPNKDVPYLKVVQLVQGDMMRRQYADALPSLLAEVRERTTLNVDPFPIYIESFEDEVIFKHPVIYVNFADRADWTLTSGEVKNLRLFIERGGFLFLDAGINASFLRGNVRHGQMHSFADWEVSPEVEAAFKQIYPERRFEPLSRSDVFFKSYYAGLPDATPLPEAIREFIINEKWPQGTYSTMVMREDDRVAVMAMPIMAMGWGKSEFGQWTTRIGFRVREGAEGLSDRLSEAAYGGESYDTTREDGRSDVIYCETPGMPAWVEEPNGDWRVFRYYHSQEISDYAHAFYTRLGVNLFVYIFSQ
ncbi:DUF4159 domain-containing protein [Opitutia bacterium ISCC 51]|nr:DUF4159 domain-containing protein [Opitutae bacterium ISCC 51]QXD28263.1 DUF4159 domain-containing protein [Opitutae bacterium ISCC 52]